MFSRFFKTKPIIDDTSKEWIFDTFAWCIAQLDDDFFKSHSELILPNNRFYPGSSTSVEQMAEIIFSKTIKYAGMTSWPIKKVPVESFVQKPMAQLSFDSALRGENCVVVNKENIPSLDIAYHSSQLNQPQDLIAYIVQRLASMLLIQHGVNAPGGKNVFAQTVDLVGCFMGFGVIFANTAYQFKGGCGSCNNRNLNRQAALPEHETVYALALFSVLKQCDISAIKKELKPHLYKTFRRAYKEISQYLEQTKDPDHALLTANFSS